MGKFGKFIGIEDEEDEKLDELEETLDEAEDEYEDEEGDEEPKKGFFSRLFNKNREEDEEDDETEENDKHEPIKDLSSNSSYNTQPAIQKTSIRPMSNPTSTLTGKNYTQQIKLVVIKPASFDEGQKLVDSLKSKKPIIINLEELDSDIARRLFDFLSGATYALNGSCQRVATGIYLFAPENVEVNYTNSAEEKKRTDTIWS